MASIIKRTYKAIVDGKVVVRECEHWTIQYRDAAGKLRRVKGYRDKAATRQLAATLERNLARGETGLVDPFKVARATPLTTHVADYVANLQAAGRDPMYVYTMRKRLARLLDGCGWSATTDIEPNSFMKWREREKSNIKKGCGRDGTGASARTLNQYLESARAFCNWCVGSGRMSHNPLAAVSKVEGAAKRKRRALSDDEVGRLLAVAGERAIVYRVGLATGLRRAELEALQWGDVRLNAIKPYMQLRSEATKARRADRLSLPQTLATELRTIKPADAGEGDSVFPAVPSIHLWKADLKVAKIPYIDAQGRQVDFHGGTRKTLCTRLHRAGVPLASAMRIMRHTDARLTLVDYTDDEALGADDAAAALPEVLASCPTGQPQPAIATA